MKAFMPFFFIPVFVIWVFYRWLLKKDLSNHKNEVIVGFVFIALWIGLYLFLTNI